MTTSRAWSLAVIGLLFTTTAISAATPSPADYDVYRGSVAFKNFGEHMLGVLVIDDRGREGGYVHLFRLWTELPLDPISVTAPAASVEYRGRELVILIPEKQLFFTFVLADSQSASPTAPSGFTSARYVGYGLNHEIRLVSSRKATGGAHTVDPRTIDCGVDGVDCFLGAENPDPNGGVGGSGSSCDAGGPGANSCSVSNPTGGGCSIGCNAGSYACCKQAWLLDTAKCFCVRQ